MCGHRPHGPQLGLKLFSARVSLSCMYLSVMVPPESVHGVLHAAAPVQVSSAFQLMHQDQFAFMRAASKKVRAPHAYGSAALAHRCRLGTLQWGVPPGCAGGGMRSVCVALGRLYCGGAGVAPRDAAESQVLAAPQATALSPTLRL